jgi:hypothetical protein
MKKLLTLTLAAIFGWAGLMTEAKANGANTSASVSTPQLRIQVGQRNNRQWRNREYRGRGNAYGRTRTTTRLVRRGWATYRETYQIRYLPNGQTYTTLISRVRVA